MRILDRLIWLELVGPFLTGIFMFLAMVFAAGSLFQAADWLVQGIPPVQVGKLVLYSLPSLITQTFPMAMLLSGLLGFGQLSSNREAVALFAAGIPFIRMARVAMLMGAAVSIVAFLWNDYVVPPASTAFWDMKTEVFKHLQKSDKPMYFNRERRDGKGLEESIAIMGGFDANKRILKNVTIIAYSTDPALLGHPAMLLHCDTARPIDDSGVNWTYYDGYTIAIAPDKKTHRIENALPISFRDMRSTPATPSIGKSFDDVLRADVTDPDRKSFRELSRDIRQQRRKGANTRADEVNLYGKIALPLASFIFGLVGSALGLTTRRGAGKTVGFGMAIGIVFIYWVFYHSMFVVGKNGGLPPFVASFAADLVGAAVAVVLAIRASR
ncbi:MAG TPA: LptF/LptG family permease [Chthonomonadaceae bacterium]|nr:LptF/LptG family permease [Chthonomonadaceae bacterium]